MERMRLPLPGREAERRAEESEARLGLALDAAGMAIFEMDMETGGLWWSEQTRRLFSLAPEIDATRTRLPQVVQRIHPEDRAVFQAAVADALAARPGDVHRVQARVVGPDGVVRWIEARGQTWENGRRRRGLRGTLVDVTELKRVEEGLRRNLEELRVVAAVAEQVADAPDEATLLERTTAVIREVFSPDNCGFLLRDETAPLLHHAPSFHTRRPREELTPIRLGTGICGRVAESGQARRVEDTRGEPDYLALDPEVRSEVCVPLKVGPRVLGVLDAESTRPAAFTKRDERLLGVAATHVASALERLRNEEALRRSGEVYRAYFTDSPLGVFVSDTHGRYLEVNGAACALTGYTREELLRMSIPDLVVADETEGLRERLTGMLAFGAGRHEIRIRRKDASVRPCLVHASAVGPDRLLGLLLDITDRKEAEEKLRDGEERFRGLSEASLEAILLHEGGTIVDVNHALCELSGYAWHELVGRSSFDLIAPEDRERVYRNLLMEYGRPYEITVIRRDGGRLPVEVRARSFPYRGKVLRVVAVRDISERKKAEEIRESLIRELEAKNAELERFGYTVSHDLKAPLVTMRGFAEYLAKDVREGRTDRLPEDAARITEAAAKVERLLDGLLELSRAGRPVGPPGPVAVEEAVREALRLVEGRLAAKRVRVEVGEGLPVVFGDRARLVHVFQNLLDNAAKFASPSAEGLVRVEARPIKDGLATVVVRDNGIGIDPKHQERVFGLFEKLDPRQEGTGIGLALVRRIVEAHGGRVWVESEGRGKGSAVCVALPWPPAQGAELAAATAGRAGARRPE
jgi:PAS domain S-box-containing protein